MIVILLLAALLRQGWPGIVQFSLDEAQTTGLALEVVRGRGVPLFGTGTSFGLPTSPVSEYVYVPAALLWDSPLWLTWFTAALNVVALALFWRLGRRYWGPMPALVATLVFATHPWAVISSRKIWEPNLIAFFAIPWAITGVMAFHEGRSKALILHLALLSVIAQMHYSGLALVPVTAAMLLLAHKRIDWRMLVVGLIVAGLIALPFAYGIVRSQGAGWRASLDFVSGRAQVDVQSFRLWWITVTGSDIHSLAGFPAYRDFVRSLPNLDAARYALGVLVTAGIGLWLWEAWQRRRDPAPSAGLLISLWAVAPLLLLIRHIRALYLHYYVVTIPALCLAAGLVLGRAMAARQRALRVGAVALLITTVGAQAISTIAILQFVGTRATPGGFRVPLQSQLQATNRARELGAPIIVLADGDDPELSEWAAVFGVLMQRDPHRILDGSRLAVFPGESATLLLTPGAQAAHEAYSRAGLSKRLEVVPNRPDEEPFRVMRLQGGFTPMLVSAPEPRRLAHGAEILGYQVDGEVRPGQAFDWWIAWRVWNGGVDSKERYHISNRIVDAAGSFVTQADGPTVSTADWRIGDLFVQRFRMELPAQTPSGPLWVWVGMYTYPEIQNQAVLDVHGQPAGEYVVMGPLPRE